MSGSDFGHTAPGKLLLAGEYAVLRGGVAVVAAMNRRARARLLAPAAPAAARAPSPFLAAVAERLTERWGKDHPAALAATRVVVDTAAFSQDGHKLGLGSSAAATVAATAAALAGGGVSVEREQVLALATAAHGDAQGLRGSRGSGADIAASTYGGLLRFCLGAQGPVLSPLPLPSSVQWLPFFTGHSADTVTMVGRVEAAGAPAQPALTALADAGSALATALLGGDGPSILTAIDSAGHALAALGRAAGYDLETAAVRAVRAALAPLGAAVKTTGAGGGDLAIAVLPGHADRNEATARIIQAGCRALPLSIDPRGVDLRQVPL